ncbi:MAG TPA: 3-deoxy-D-manno-octulosonic acid transferase [Acidobacteriota bacterium]|nr:3-deoxy-D-manno-octulosonic acid transferase [Acidobacteriota bacterium]
MIRFLQPIYTALYAAGLLVYAPFLLYRVAIRGKKVGLQQRFGSLSGLHLDDKSRPRIWIHAVSVGEVNAIGPLARRLIDDGFDLFLSTTTDTGQEQARRLFGDSLVVFYVPLDFVYACRRVLRQLQPDLLVLAESEIWPNLIVAASRLQIPIFLVNGRISDASFRRYMRTRLFLRPLLQLISLSCMQSEQDRQRMIRLGARAENVFETGNLKFDYRTPDGPSGSELRRTVIELLDIGPESTVWLCGSTREGEEEKLFPVYLRLRGRFPGLRWIIAPRHPHRGGAVEALLQRHGISAVRRSQLPLNDAPARRPVAETEALVLDSIGELPFLYRIADVVFVGGSLVPAGGHNPIEAAACGKPVLFGPSMENFREVARIFLENDAAGQVQSERELETCLRRLLGDPAERKWLGEKALNQVRKNQGAVEKTCQVIRSRLNRQAEASSAMG